jgi:tetratricopeptide (TPR) repeat protein
MPTYRYILLFVLLGLVSTTAYAGTRCFEEMIGGLDETCSHGPMKSKLSMRQVICDFRLECPEHNQAIEWQEVPSVSKALVNFSLSGADVGDLARWHVLRAKELLYAGQYANAIDECDEALEMLQRKEDQVLSWYSLYFKGIALKHEHAYQEADEVLGEALGMATSINDQRFRLYALYAISDLMEFKEDHVKALEYYREFHRLHQLLNEQSAKIKEERDSVLVASIALSAKAGASVWQWRALALFLIFLMFLMAFYFRAPLFAWFYSGRLAKEDLGANYEDGKKATFGLRLPSRDTQTDEEILVDEVKIERLAALRNVRLLTQEDWETFQAAFSEIYPDFLVKLRYMHPEITQAEEKLSCLLRIHYGTKDVARTLAISPQSVSVSRYRLRKRMGLPLQRTLEEYIMSF